MNPSHEHKYSARQHAPRALRQGRRLRCAAWHRHRSNSSSWNRTGACSPRRIRATWAILCAAAQPQRTLLPRVAAAPFPDYLMLPCAKWTRLVLTTARRGAAHVSQLAILLGLIIMLTGVCAFLGWYSRRRGWSPESGGLALRRRCVGAAKALHVPYLPVPCALGQPLSLPAMSFMCAWTVNSYRHVCAFLLVSVRPLGGSHLVAGKRDVVLRKYTPIDVSKGLLFVIYHGCSRQCG